MIPCVPPPLPYARGKSKVRVLWGVVGMLFFFPFSREWVSRSNLAEFPGSSQGRGFGVEMIGLLFSWFWYIFYMVERCFALERSIW